MSIIKRHKSNIAGLSDKYISKDQVNNLLSQNINVLTGNVDGQDTTLLTGEDFGWRDLMSDIRVSGSGNANPSWGQFRNGIFAHLFQSNRINECWANFHIDHDYALGTRLYPHVHWSPLTSATGTVRWGFEYTVAKGHAQGQESIYPATSLIYVEETITEDRRFTHFITETNEEAAIPPERMEPDTLILLRVFRDANNDTYPDSVAAFMIDLHYQVARLTTKNKAPDFYVS